MKYNIEVSGRGCEAFIFKLDEDQHNILLDGDVEGDQMSVEEVCGVLGIDDFFSTDDCLTGLYNGKNHGEYLWIKVTDEDGNVVWESEENFDFEEIEDYYEFNDGNFLLVEDYQKGNFFNFTLETDEDFNPLLLSGKVIELLDGRQELITDMKYNGEEMLKDYGDTSSKGFTYILL